MATIDLETLFKETAIQDILSIILCFSMCHYSFPLQEIIPSTLTYWANYCN